MAQAQTLAEQIVDAEDALHELSLGRSPTVVVDQNGERVEYARANRPQLKAYIRELKQRQTSGSDAGVPGSPMGIVF